MIRNNKKAHSGKVINVEKDMISLNKVLGTEIIQSNNKWHFSTEILKGKEFVCATSKGLDFVTKSKLKIYDPHLLQVNNEIQNMLNTCISHYTNQNVCDNTVNDDTKRSLLKMEESSSNESSLPQIDLFHQSNGLNKKTSIKKTPPSLDKSEKDINILSINNTSEINTERSNRNFTLSDRKNKQKSTIISSNKIEPRKIENKTKRMFSFEKTINNNESSKRQILSLPNVYDSFSDEEVDINEVTSKNKCYISPESNFISYWESIMFAFILYGITISPYLLAFSVESYFTITFDIISDIIFLFDLIIYFFIAFYDSEFDILITSKQKIAIRVLTNFFLIDLCSSIPFSIICLFLKNNSSNDGGIREYKQIQDTGSTERLIRSLKWLKLLKIFKYKLNKKGINTNTSNKRFHLLSVLKKTKLGVFIKFLLFISLLVHCCSCMWIFIGKLYINDLKTESWLNSFQMAKQSNIAIYTTSLYFLMNSMLSDGYGDITATSLIERIFMTFFLIIGCAIYSLMLTTLSSIFSKIEPKTLIFSQKELMLEQLKNEYPIPDSLYDNIKKALKHDYYSWKEDQIKLLDSLPGSLKNDLYLKMHEKQIKHLIFFKNQSYDFILFTVPLLKSVHYSRDDLILNVGNLVEEMFLIVRGMVSLRLGYKYDNYEIGVLKYGEHFGDIIMYLNDQSNYEIKIKSKSAELLVLSKTNFANIKLNFREAINEIIKYSYKVFTQIEKRRNLAIQYYQKNGKFEGFKVNYMNTILQNEALTQTLINNNIYDNLNINKPIIPLNQTNSTISNSNEEILKRRESLSFPLSPRKSLFHSNTPYLYQNYLNPSNNGNNCNNTTIYVNNFNINCNEIKKSPSLDLFDIKKRRIINDSNQIDFQMYYDKEAFLQSLNQKIENNGMMNHNKNFIQNYIIDYLEEKEEQTKTINMIKKLNKMEKLIKKIENSNIK